MKTEKEPVLEIRIQIDQKGLKMQTEFGEVSMIPFGGSCDCELFKGIVEPWGVDRQIVDQTGMRHLSARYVLSGKDKEGNDCHIYIENNGTMENRPSFHFETVPTLLTDSPYLAPIFHHNHFLGTGDADREGLWIRFYKIV